eukprot:c7866_g1_i5.p1 GENE.c7866_g1_i5~~c7866_g1_i5.p1  ORF type:complete len:265 (-),score=82.50 c7866_g1_i5:43-837(-)
MFEQMFGNDVEVKIVFGGPSGFGNIFDILGAFGDVDDNENVIPEHSKPSGNRHNHQNIHAHQGLGDLLFGLFDSLQPPTVATEEDILTFEVPVPFEVMYSGGEAVLPRAETHILERKFRAWCNRCNSQCSEMCHNPSHSDVVVTVPPRAYNTQIVNVVDFPYRIGNQKIRVSLITQPHAMFIRAGNDIVTSHSITLAKSVLGFTDTIKHVDGHDVVVCAVKVTPPGHEIRIPGEGFLNGDLVVRINVIFPESSEEFVSSICSHV